VNANDRGFFVRDYFLDGQKVAKSRRPPPSTQSGLFDSIFVRSEQLQKKIDSKFAIKKTGHSFHQGQLLAGIVSNNQNNDSIN
jgi:hypothetical protein